VTVNLFAGTNESDCDDNLEDIEHRSEKKSGAVRGPLLFRVKANHGASMTMVGGLLSRTDDDTFQEH
jgi:hypothetical protein